MEFVHSKTYGSLTRDINVINGPVCGQPTSTTGRQFRVTGVNVIFGFYRGDGWAVKHVTLRGPVLRKDGSESRNEYSGPPLYQWERKPEHAWLLKLVDAIRPEGMPELPFRLTGLENSDDLDA
jgi:hypothetical protein